MVHYLSFDEVGITIAVIGIALAFVVLVWNAVKAIHDWRMMAHKPTAETLENHEVRIKSLEECCIEVRTKLDADWQWQQDEREMNSLMLRSIKQLLQHEVDNGDAQALRQIEAEIDDWLVQHAM